MNHFKMFFFLQLLFIFFFFFLRNIWWATSSLIVGHLAPVGHTLSSTVLLLMTVQSLFTLNICISFSYKPQIIPDIIALY